MNPEAAVLVFLALVTLILVLMRNKSLWALRLFVVFVWSSFVSALVAFVFMIAMWSVIEERFKADGWKVRWGPLVSCTTLSFFFYGCLPF